MVDHDSNAINAIGSPWERENERRKCRCGTERESECVCADELRDRERDDREHA